MHLSREALVFLLESQQPEQEPKLEKEVEQTTPTPPNTQTNQIEKRFINKADEALLVKDPLREVITTLVKTKMNQ